jgi:hypothetical protein
MLLGVVAIGIRTALRRSERRKAIENQDKREGWFWWGQTDREHKLFVRQSGVLTPVGRRGFRREETMKTKTNLKAGEVRDSHDRYAN